MTPAKKFWFVDTINTFFFFLITVIQVLLLSNFFWEQYCIFLLQYQLNKMSRLSFEYRASTTANAVCACQDFELNKYFTGNV